MCSGGGSHAPGFEFFFLGGGFLCLLGQRLHLRVGFIQCGFQLCNALFQRLHVGARRAQIPQRLVQLHIKPIDAVFYMRR